MRRRCGGSAGCYLAWDGALDVVAFYHPVHANRVGQNGKSTSRPPKATIAATRKIQMRRTQWSIMNRHSYAWKLHPSKTI